MILVYGVGKNVTALNCHSFPSFSNETTYQMQSRNTKVYATLNNNSNNNNSLNSLYYFFYLHANSTPECTRNGPQVGHVTEVKATGFVCNQSVFGRVLVNWSGGDSQVSSVFFSEAGALLRKSEVLMFTFAKNIVIRH